MLLQLKSVFKNKITIVLLTISMIISIFSIYNIHTRINTPNYDMYYDNLSYYIEWSDMLNKYKNQTFNPDERQENYINYLEWQVKRHEILMELYLDSYKENSELIKDYNFIFALTRMNVNSNPEFEQKITNELYPKEMEKYVNFDLVNFDFELLGDFTYDYLFYDEGFSDSVYKVNKFFIEYVLYLWENDLKEINYFTESPWTYLGETYSKESIKSKFFIPITILFSAFILTLSRKEKTLDLISVNKSSKFRIYLNYLLKGFLVSLILVFLPDVVSVIYMGIRFGFEGLFHPIPVFLETFNSFQTYANSAIASGSVGLADLYPLHDPLSAYPFFNFKIDLSNDLVNIEFWKFLVLGMIMEVSKIGLFSLIGVSLGLLIKDIRKSFVISGILVIFSVISGILIELQSKWNIFSFNSGWNVALGWTKVSWLWAMILIYITIFIIIIINYIAFRKRDIV